MGFSQIGHSWVHGNKSLALKSRTLLAVFFQGQRKATALLCWNMSLELQGHVSLHRHGALIQSVPARAPDVPSDLSPPAPCPTAADIAAKLRSGEMSLHASRVPLTRESLNSALVTVQKQLKLPTGINGGWTLEANAKLAYNLLQAKRGSKGCGKKNQPLCDLEDQRPQTSPPSTSLKRKKTQSSSSSSSSSSSRFHFEIAAAETHCRVWGCHWMSSGRRSWNGRTSFPGGRPGGRERQPACDLTDRLGAEKKQPCMVPFASFSWNMFLLDFSSPILKHLKLFLYFKHCGA